MTEFLTAIGERLASIKQTARKRGLLVERC